MPLLPSAEFTVAALPPALFLFEAQAGAWLWTAACLALGGAAAVFLPRAFRPRPPSTRRPAAPQFDPAVAQGQKMEAIGRLAGGIAHDFNNLLTVIGGNCQLARLGLPAGHPSVALIDEATAAADRAAALTAQLLLFSRQKPIELTRLDLNKAVEQALALLRRLIGEHIVVAARPGAGLPRVLAAHGLISQVLLNLAVNARDAMPRGGKLTIETAAARGPRGEPLARLVVTDTGCGIPQEVLPHIFEPFYTTKEIGKGTGLGLATVYGIVRSLGGEVRVRSRIDYGTCFEIDLPAAPGSAEEAAAAAPAPAAPVRAAVVLLVEDEGAVRSVCEKALAAAGFEVIAADRPDAALEQLERHGMRIDLLLTDVVMPVMSGRELARAVRGKFPQIRTLYMSGYVRDELGYEDSRGEELWFIQKPFAPDALVARVRQTLEGS